MSDTAYHAMLEEHAVLKRFNERWIADPAFRRALREDAAGTLDRYGLPCSPDDVRSLIDPGTAKPSAATRAMWRIVCAKKDFMNQFYGQEGLPADRRMLAWRDRQIARQLLELGPFHTNSNLHASLSIELTKGCSVGCWFCGLSPGRLSGVFEYSESNRSLWLGTLRVIRDTLGPAAKTGFLYWASDPLDNPDYMRFCIDFHEVIGVFPPTTTALALQEPARTRDLLRVSRERGCWLNRFSAISLDQLDRIHSEFTAEELAHVQCLPVNRESAFVFANAGRFRERAVGDPDVMREQRKNLQWASWYTGNPAYANTVDHPLATIGCVSGFLLNMVDRRVQLISPCAANERWPEGSHVFDQAEFHSSGDLARQLDRMIEEHMSPVLRPHDRPRFHNWLGFEDQEDGFRLTGRFHQQAAFCNKEQKRQWRLIGDLVRCGRRTVAEVSGAVAAECGITIETVQSMLNELLSAGVIDESGA